MINIHEWSPDQPKPSGHNRRIKVCAHRGSSGTHPENTAAAYDEAVRVGADMIEFDVRRCRDGGFIVMHDPAVDRTTNGSGMIADLSSDEIRRLDAGNGEQVPKLGQAFAYAERMILNVHAYPETDEDVESMADVLVELFSTPPAYDRGFVTSQNVSILRRIRALDPRIRLCCLLAQRDSKYVQLVLQRIDCDVLQPSNTIVTPQFVAEAHDRGLKVNPFFANEEGEMRRVIACGVDGLLTDFPARLIQVLEAG